MSKNQHLKPSGLHNNPAYSHVVVASGARTIYISGQVATDDAKIFCDALDDHSDRDVFIEALRSAVSLLGEE